MPGYALTWVDVARDQYASLEPADQHLVDLRLLMDHPDGPGCSEDTTTGQWLTSDRLSHGLILYSFRPGRPRLVVLRLVY